LIRSNCGQVEPIAKCTRWRRCEHEC
jgi:hypothetical protein